MIWGELDPALGVELLDGLDEVAPHVCIHRVPDSSHWVQNEVPAEVNRMLVDFLQIPEMYLKPASTLNSYWNHHS